MSRRGVGVADHSHLHLMHGVYTGDVKKLADIVACHEAAHAGLVGQIRPHVHH